MVEEIYDADETHKLKVGDSVKCYRESDGSRLYICYSGMPCSESYSLIFERFHKSAFTEQLFFPPTQKEIKHPSVPLDIHIEQVTPEEIWLSYAKRQEPEDTDSE